MRAEEVQGAIGDSPQWCLDVNTPTKPLKRQRAEVGKAYMSTIDSFSMQADGHVYAKRRIN